MIRSAVTYVEWYPSDYVEYSTLYQVSQLTAILSLNLLTLFKILAAVLAPVEKNEVVQ